MMGFGRSIIRAGALRAALALVLVAVLALQAGLFAASGTTPADATHMTALVPGEHDAPPAAVSEAAEADCATRADHCRSDFADRSCDVHCATAHAVPVEGARLALPARARFEPDDQAPTLRGLTHEFSQPPRA